MMLVNEKHFKMLLLNVCAVKQDLRARSLLMKEKKIWSKLFNQQVASVCQEG